MISLNILREAYYNSPLWMKKIISKIPLYFREGAEYYRWKKFLNSEINEEEYELLKLKETIFYAYNYVPYYKKLFNKNSISPEDINEISDLQKIPILTKKLLVDNISELRAENFNSNKCFYVTTGGSTGKPVELYQSNNVWKKELAFTHNLFENFGYNKNSKIASFRLGEFKSLGENIYWKENPIRNEYKFSPYHINKNAITAYVDKLNSVQPEFFLTYSSTILLLLNSMIEAGVKLNYQPVCVFLVSERTKLDEINYIKTNLNCEVTSFYGLTERIVFAPMIRENNYVIKRRYGFCELVDKDGLTIEKNNTEGVIVGTSFENFAMPLIRYDTGDISSYVDYDTRKINAIKGRENEFLDCVSSQKISVTSLIMHDDIFRNVLTYQYYQPRKGKTILRVIPKKDFSNTDIERIKKQFNMKIGHAIEFDVEKVEDLSRNARGKIKHLVKDY